MMKKQLILLKNQGKNIPNSGLEGTNHTLFQTKMVEIDTLFQTKTAKKTFWLGTYLYSLYNGLPPGTKNVLKIMSLAAYASETNNDEQCCVNAFPER